MTQLPAKEVYKFIDNFERKTEFLEFARSELGLKNNEINGVLEDYNDSREQKYQIISLWKRKRGRQATIQHLHELRRPPDDPDDGSYGESCSEAFLGSKPCRAGGVELSRGDRPTTRQPVIAVRAQVDLLSPVDPPPANSASGTIREMPNTDLQVGGEHHAQNTGNVSDRSQSSDNFKKAGDGNAIGLLYNKKSQVPGGDIQSTSQVNLPEPISPVAGVSHRQEDRGSGQSVSSSVNTSLGRGQTIPENPGIDSLPSLHYEVSGKVDKMSNPSGDGSQELSKQRSSKDISADDEELMMKSKTWITEEEIWCNPQNDGIHKPPKQNECSGGSGTSSDNINNALVNSMANANIGLSAMCDEVTILNVINCSKDDIQEILRKDNIYTIKNKPKGYVVILNYNFTGERGFRTGANFDVENMRELWKRFDCSVIVKEDLHAEKVRDAINTIALSEKMKKYDFFVLIIMSHGRDDSFKTGDRKYIKVEEVLRKFDNENAEHLIGKPKLFFFQFCRGTDIDQGFSTTATNPTNATEYQPDLDIAHSDYTSELHTVRSDMLISYPTQSGYRSYRGERGSWFMNAIANVFSKYARKEHVAEMMARVRRAVMEKTGAIRKGETANVICKEMSESRDLLSKKLYLMPGYPEDDLL